MKASMKLLLVLVDVFILPLRIFDGHGNTFASSISPSSFFGSLCELWMRVLGVQRSILCPSLLCFFSCAEHFLDDACECLWGIVSVAHDGVGDRRISDDLPEKRSGATPEVLSYVGLICC